MTEAHDESEPSRRAVEEVEDFFDDVTRALDDLGSQASGSLFHLDGTDRYLGFAEARQWALDSVDDGFPRLRFFLEQNVDGQATVNLAAFQDPDSQYFP